VEVESDLVSLPLEKVSTASVDHRVANIECWANESEKPHNVIAPVTSCFDHSKCKHDHASDTREEEVEINGERLGSTLFVEEERHRVGEWNCCERVKQDCSPNVSIIQVEELESIHSDYARYIAHNEIKSTECSIVSYLFDPTDNLDVIQPSFLFIDEA
jgi:hypothetical protein